MDLYPVFKVAMHSIKTSMHAMRLKEERKLERPDDIQKTSYHYSLNRNHQFNIYRDAHKDTCAAPLVIDIHGGCWFYGDKDYYDAFSYELVRGGFNVSSLTYRLADKVHLKDQIQDIFKYMHYLEENAGRLGISLDNVVLTGDSAGAQLSLLTYAINHSPRLQKIFQVKPFHFEIKAMALTHPVCFIDTAAGLAQSEKLSRHIAQPGLQRLLYGAGYERKPEYTASVTPDRYIVPGMKLPPMMVLTSQGDTQFHYQSERLAHFFDKRQIDYEYYDEKNPASKHVYNINHPQREDSKAANEALMHFFRSHIEPAEVLA